MTRYAVGDLQGCLKPLQSLLKTVDFNPNQDELWLVGDLINRGPNSLETLRFIKNLGSCTRIVLGNHDLHFLAVAYGATSPNKSDTLSPLLEADDRDELVQWMRHQPLLYTDPSGDYSMVHAGIPPIWSLNQSHQYAAEVEQVLQSENIATFLHTMYGNEPECWDSTLSSWVRLRTITNYFTRMRFCTAHGKLDFKHKESTINKDGFAPWFTYPPCSPSYKRLIFGHWASLQGKIELENIFALDTGCIWGGTMTIMNLENKTFNTCKCTNNRNNSL